MKKMKRTSVATALTAVSLFVLLITGCASGGSSPSGSSGEGGGSGAIADAAEWDLAYAQCMRGEGLDVPDPEEGGASGVTVSQDNADEFSAGDEKCRESLGERPQQPGEEQLTEEEALAQALKVAQCFRDNGVDVRDPEGGMAGAVPADAPEEVVQKCIGGIGGAPVELSEPGE